MTQAAQTAAPFMKWAGGKGQLSDQIDRHLPPELKAGKVARYVEPFVGGGAVLFHIAEHYPVSEYFISDNNPELILVYRTLKTDVDQLISNLSRIQKKYEALEGPEREAYFYEMRDELNDLRHYIDLSKPEKSWFKRAAMIIFLNRTCYNGLYRVNRKGEFNVPFGRYKNPRICAPDNLRAVAQILSNTTIHFGDFEDCRDIVDSKTFVYFDPPYRPISRTASFNAYSRTDFDDDQQLRLARYFGELHKTGAKLMLSNSDPQNTNPDDHFFLDAYAGFRIERVQALRMINSNAQKRGPINELLVMNYD